MSNVNENTRVSAKQILKDVDSYHALAGMSDFRAHNPENSREAADVAYQELRAAEQNAVTTSAAAEAAADALVVSRRKFHGVIIGVKNEARALYGPSSDQVAALGLKKKSEQTKRARSKKAAEK